MSELDKLLRTLRIVVAVVAGFYIASGIAPVILAFLNALLVK